MTHQVEYKYEMPFWGEEKWKSGVMIDEIFELQEVFGKTVFDAAMKFKEGTGIEINSASISYPSEHRDGMTSSGGVEVHIRWPSPGIFVPIRRRDGEGGV